MVYSTHVREDGIRCSTWLHAGQTSARVEEADLDGPWTSLQTTQGVDAVPPTTDTGAAATVLDVLDELRRQPAGTVLTLTVHTHTGTHCSTRVVFVRGGGSRGTSPSLDLTFPPTGLSEDLGGMERGRGGKGKREGWGDHLPYFPPLASASNTTLCSTQLVYAKNIDFTISK